MSVAVLVAALALSSAPPTKTPATAPTTSPPTTTSVVAGIYDNERGSVLELISDGHGHLTGTFSSGVGNVETTKRFDVVGVENGDVVAFVVTFGSTAGSVGAWTGQLVGDELHTLWHLAKDVADADEKMGLWSSVRTNADVFRRRSPTTSAPTTAPTAAPKKKAP